MGLTAIILTNKEPKDISPTINSLSFADEVILVSDAVSKPTQINNKFTLYYQSLDQNFAAQRNFGISKAKGDWVLFVDDDEIVTQSLAAEIKAAIHDPKYTGYYLKRLDCYFGQTLHHGETGNIKIIRLARKDAGRFVRPVHEVWQVKGEVGELKNPLIHSRGELVAPFIDRIVLYAPIDAKELFKEGKPFSYWRLFANPLAKFITNYKIKRGFLDGYLGLFQAYLMSVQSLTIRVFQWQKKF